MSEIIDGVDVSGCEFYIQDYQRANNIEGRYEHCKDVCELNGDNYFYCKMNKDCYYKQLQRAKAENKELERKYADVLKLAKENADSNEYCLQELEQENERIKRDFLKQNQWLQDQKEEIDELKAENERLKEEVEHYRKEAYRLADGLNNIENLAFTYKQALQKIRVIVSEPCIVDENCQTCKSNCMQKDILDKINEVIGEK